MKPKMLRLLFLAAAVFALAFLLSGAAPDLKDHAAAFVKSGIGAFDLKIKGILLKYVNVFTVYNDKPRYHFLFPPGTYSKSYVLKNISHTTAFPVLFNAFFNSVFQPLFLCVFTPQVVLVYALFPFFLYGCLRYFKKVPLMVIFFIWYSVFIGLKQPVVEALVRHRLSCELLYLSIGLAGFFYLTQRRSS